MSECSGKDCNHLSHKKDLIKDFKANVKQPQRLPELIKAYRETPPDKMAKLVVDNPPKLNVGEVMPFRGYNYQVKATEGNEVLMTVLGPTMAHLKKYRKG